MVSPEPTSSRRVFLAQSASIVTAVASDLWKNPAYAALPPEAWNSILEAATKFVAAESPAEIFPFQQPSKQLLRRSQKKVFADYFTPFPLSFKNLPPNEDTYERQLMAPQGQGGRFKAVGGYIRERPLAVGPWHSPNWKNINLAIDLLRAQRIGIDGFIVDLLRLPQNPGWNELLDVYLTAAHVAPEFGLIPEPDTSGLRSARAGDVAAALETLARAPSSYHLADGRMLISPVVPERYTVEWWTELLSMLEDAGVHVAFLPTFLQPLKAAAKFAPLSFGLSYWGVRDVASVTGSADISVQRLLRHYSANFMQPIAPQDVRPKVRTYSESQNTELFRSLWMEAILNGAEFVHLITWNDFSEATEIEPSTGIHFLMYDLSCYYTTWFKTGSAPSIIYDAIFYCHRTELESEGSDEIFRRVGATAVINKVEMLAFLVKPATLEIELDGNTSRRQVGAGLKAFTVDARLDSLSLE